MQEIKGDLFEQEADAVCITTNGFIKKNGEGVMGRGVALQAKQRWPDIARHLGERLRLSGNHVGLLASNNTLGWLLAFPVKHLWNEPADLALIRRSVLELIVLADEKHWHRVCLPRPGCGNGGLDWKEVKPLLASILDDRFVIIQN